MVLKVGSEVNLIIDIIYGVLRPLKKKLIDCAGEEAQHLPRAVVTQWKSNNSEATKLRSQKHQLFHTNSKV